MRNSSDSIYFFERTSSLVGHACYPINYCWNSFLCATIISRIFWNQLWFRSVLGYVFCCFIFNPCRIMLQYHSKNWKKGSLYSNSILLFMYWNADYWNNYCFDNWIHFSLPGTSPDHTALQTRRALIAERISIT